MNTSLHWVVASTRAGPPASRWALGALCISLGFASVALAAGPSAPPPHVAVLHWTHVHDMGRVPCLATNFGVVGSSPGSATPYAALPSMEWPRGSGVDYLYSGGLWIGALTSGTPAVTTATFQIEFRPGMSELDRIYVAAEGQPPPELHDDLWIGHIQPFPC